MAQRVTENFSLAVTLATLGVPFADPERPEWKEVTPEILAENGCKTLHEAAAAGIEGRIAYAFAEHPDRDTICKAFNDAFHAPSPQQNESLTIPDTLTIGGIDIQTVQLLGMFAAALFKNRKKFGARRRMVPPKLRLVAEDGSTKIVGKDAKPDDLKHLGIT